MNVKKLKVGDKIHFYNNDIHSFGQIGFHTGEIDKINPKSVRVTKHATSGFDSTIVYTVKFDKILGIVKGNKFEKVKA